MAMCDDFGPRATQPLVPARDKLFKPHVVIEELEERLKDAEEVIGKLKVLAEIYGWPTVHYACMTYFAKYGEG